MGVPNDCDFAVVSIPESAGGLEKARSTLEDVLRKCPAIVAVTGGSSLDRVLLCEDIRLGGSALAMIVDDHAKLVAAETSIMSGRADFFGVTLDHLGDRPSFR